MIRKLILSGLIIPLFVVNAQQSNKNMTNYQHLSKNELALINQKSNDTKFRVLQTTDAADLKILRAKSIDIYPKDESTRKLAERMFATVQDEESKGVGIAAPQIGINRKAVWIQRFDKKNEPFEFFINPNITWYSDIKRKGREGCLSIPDLVGQVVRSLTIRIEYYDLDGKFHDEVIEGFTAVIAQHEFDHLTGTLFPDRLKEQDQKNYKEASSDQELLYEKASD